MRIILSPQRNDAPVPSVSVSGNTLTIDGQEISLSGLQEGDSRTSSEIGNAYVVAAANVAGTISVTIISPFPANATDEQRQEYTYDIEAGSVTFPDSPDPEEDQDPDEESVPGVIDPEEALAEERAAMVVSRFQAKAALLSVGLLEVAEATVAASNSPLVRLAWAEAIEWRRLSPTIASLQAELGLTDTYVDNLFRAAALIEA